VATTKVRRHVGANSDLGQQVTQSIDRALTILEAFSSLQPEVGVQELAVKFGLTPSTVSRLLATLESHGFVEQDRFTGRFRLGLSALELGYCYASTNSLIIRAVPHLEALSQRLGLSAHLYGLAKGQLIRYMSVLNPPRQSLTGGFRYHPHPTSAGKLLLANLDPEELQNLLATIELPAATDRSVTTVEELRRELAIVRQQGYGVDNEESRRGQACLSVPVRDATGTVIAAISISGPVSRLSEEQRPALLEELFDRAYQLSQAMGYVAGQAL
jgi:IclR family KDG regulon transcriptional repressor